MNEQEEKKWIEERKSQLTAKEQLQFEAAQLRTNAKTNADIINCLLTLKDYEVRWSAGSYYQLGKYYLTYLKPIPVSAMEFVDLWALGKAYEDEHPGIFIGGECYVEYPDGEIQHPYQGNLDGICEDRGWSLMIKLASADVPEGIWLKLPDYSGVDSDDEPGEIAAALSALGADQLSECSVLEARCILPQIQNLIEQYPHAEELVCDGNNLGFILDEQGQGMPNFAEKLKAALRFEDCETLKYALDISQNLQCYDIVLGKQVEAVGRRRLEKDPLLDQCMDFKGYGGALLWEDGYACADEEGTFIRRNDQEFHYEFSEKPDSMTMEL